MVYFGQARDLPSKQFATNCRHHKKFLIQCKKFVFDCLKAKNLCINVITGGSRKKHTDIVTSDLDLKVRTTFPWESHHRKQAVAGLQNIFIGKEVTVFTTVKNVIRISSVHDESNTFSVNIDIVPEAATYEPVCDFVTTRHPETIEKDFILQKDQVVQDAVRFIKQYKVGNHVKGFAIESAVLMATSRKQKKDDENIVRGAARAKRFVHWRYTINQSWEKGVERAVASFISQ